MMKTRFIIIVLLIVVCFKSSEGQKSYVAHMVKVDDSISRKLYTFIQNKSPYKVTGGMYVFHLLGEDEKSHFSFVEGIYRFRIIGSHHSTYLFIYTKENGVQIITNYSIESVIGKINEYFKKNEATLDEEKKLNYMEEIIQELKRHQHIPGAEVLKQ
ncbi:MAG TPA: hypothetical protein VK668_08355 [Mucilaginibacter sp.]|nr:hypothetical protein [Mucilaginibacter sp.]